MTALDMGQMGSTRMEEQELTAHLAAMKIKKEDAIGKRRNWRGGEGREVREGGSERKREERDLGTRRARRGHTERRELAEK